MLTGKETAQTAGVLAELSDSGWPEWPGWPETCMEITEMGISSEVMMMMMMIALFRRNKFHLEHAGGSACERSL